MKGIDSLEDLKRAFNKFLHEAQPDVPESPHDAADFTSDPAIVQSLLAVYRVECELNDLDQEKVISEEEFAAQSVGLERLRQASLGVFSSCDVLADIFNLCTTFVFCAPPSVAGSAHGGSTSAAIGSIWAAPLEDRTDSEIAEFFVHELSHNLVHIDELCNELYVEDRIARSENFSRSAILARERPLDKSFHSLVVATEILLFRERYVGHRRERSIHPASSQLLASAVATLDHIRKSDARRRLLQPRAIELISLCEEELNQLRLS